MAQPLGPARKEDVDLAAIKEWLHFDPLTGDFAWKKNRKRQKAGSRAGVTTHHGYMQIVFQRRIWPAHKLAWVYHYSEWPELSIDHIDRDGTNNRIANLRLATWVQQQANKWVPSQSKTGIKGVSLDKRTGKFLAKIRIDGRARQLGTFDTPQAAGAAYKKAARKHYGEFATFEGEA